MGCVLHVNREDEEDEPDEEEEEEDTQAITAPDGTDAGSLPEGDAGSKTTLTPLAEAQPETSTSAVNTLTEKVRSQY